MRHSIIQAKMASSSVERTGYPNRIWMGFEGVRGLFEISGTYGPSHTKTVRWKLYEFTELDELQHVYKPSITCL